MRFASDEWLGAWAAASNADARFRAAGAGWQGAVGLVVTGPPAVYLRLDGAEGVWTSHARSGFADSLAGCVFTLSAARDTWRDVLTGTVDPVRALVTGRVRVHGQLSAVLRRMAALRTMVELAATLPTGYEAGAP